MPTLHEFGWNDFFAGAYRDPAMPNGIPGRVVRSARGQWTVATDAGEVIAQAGRRIGERDLPVTGDWVVLARDTHRIEAVLPRRTKFSRKQPGREVREQVLAANLDVLLVVAGLDGDFNPRRLERYLLLAGEGGVEPAIVLNKADLCPDPSRPIEQARSLAAGAPVLLISALTGTGLDQLALVVRAGQTAALAGSSGAGKSTIMNALLGAEWRRTQPVAADGRGRHTTTGRDLLTMPGGWLLLDMPGLRELQLWGGADSVQSGFSDIAALAARCRFRDCRHQLEPGCAVLRAVAAGELDPARAASYLKLQREIEHLERKQDQAAALVEKRRWKRIHQAAKQIRYRW